MATQWLDWSTLESRIPLDELPVFQRAFLKALKPEENWDEVFLRKVQSRFQARLKELEREGRIREENGKVWLDAELVPEAFKKYLGD